MKFLVFAVCIAAASAAQVNVPPAHHILPCAGEDVNHDAAVKIAHDCHLQRPKGRVAGGKECPTTCTEIALGLVSEDLKAVSDEKKIAEGLAKSHIYNAKQAGLVAKAFVASGCHKHIQDEKACDDHVNLNHCFAAAALKGCGITHADAEKAFNDYLANHPASQGRSVQP